VLEQLSSEVSIITEGGDFTDAPAFATGIPGTGFSVACTACQILVGISGAVIDLTGGEDFAAATPFATGLGVSSGHIYRDSSGTLWSSGLSEILDITEGGDFSNATPYVTNNPAGKLADRAGMNLVSDRSGDRVLDYTDGGDLQTLPVFADTPSPTMLLDAGSSGLFAVSSSTDSVYEISAGGDLSGAPPICDRAGPDLCHRGPALHPGSRTSQRAARGSRVSRAGSTPISQEDGSQEISPG
jgi:hypothetical protein